MQLLPEVGLQPHHKEMKLLQIGKGSIIYHMQSPVKMATQIPSRHQAVRTVNGGMA